MVSMLAVTLTLIGCGGGDPGRDVYSDGPFDVNVVYPGQSGKAYSSSGTIHRVSFPAGGSVEMDAYEPVVWDLLIGGVRVSDPGTVYYGDVAITLVELSRSRVVIDTAIRYPLSAPLSITLVATSIRYGDQAARFEVFLTP